MRSERLGLTIVGASLFTMALVIGLLFEQQRSAQEAQIKSQGISLTRLLSSLPYDQLVPGDNREGILQLLRHIQGSNFAYGAIVDKNGQPLNYVLAPGTLVPPTDVALEPSSWIGERVLQSANETDAFREFHAPILVKGELLGYVRTGYFEPRYAFSVNQLSFFGMLALPIFLATTFCYLLIKREMAPMRLLDTQVRKLVDAQDLSGGQTELGADLRDFAERFHRFIVLTGDRIHELEAAKSDLLVTTNLLSYKRSKVESVLQSLPDPIVVLDETGTATFTNAKIESLLGVKTEAVQGHRLEEWCEDQDLLTFLAAFKSAAGTRNRSNSLDFLPSKLPGKNVSVSAYPLFSPNDTTTLLGTLIVFRDTTLQTMIEKARGDFVAHLAHELKSPLNVLRMYSEMLLGEDGKAEEFRVEAVNVIHDEVDRLALLIANLLNIHKIEMGSLALNLQRVKLRDLLQDVFDSVTRAGSKQALEFKSQLPRELSPVAIDKDLFRIAVNNLLTNAIKYNRPGGSVSLEAEETADALMIHVRDTGIGIAPEDQTRIFDKFYRVQNEACGETSGHGLGLSLAKQIIEMHHGKITVQSQPGVGTEFTIALLKSHRLVQEPI